MKFYKVLCLETVLILFAENESQAVTIAAEMGYCPIDVQIII